MRLALVISHLSSGGSQRVISIMANYWAKKGWQITLLTLDDGVELPFYDLHPAVVYHPLGLSSDSSNLIQGGVNNLKRLWVLRQALKKHTPQVVISFMDRPNILTILATLGLRLPVVISERTDPAQHQIGRTWDLLRKWAYPHCSYLVAQSQSAVSYFSAKVQRRAGVIPNPVMRPAGCATRPQYARKTKAKTLLAMGRLSEEKGFDLLLRAFAGVSLQHPEWSLRIWGDGPLRPALERLRDALDLQDRVSFPGRTRHPGKQMGQADLFILSSHYEGFPNVLCEAMACGLPVISFDCPSGPREVITDGVDGVLVPPQDVGALAAAMDRLMSGTEERQRLAAHACGIIERFSLQKVMGMWEDVIAEYVPASAPQEDPCRVFLKFAGGSTHAHREK